MDYEAIRRLAKGTGYETKLEEMLSWNLSDTNYKGIAKQLLRDAPLSDIPTIFVQSLISADIVEPTSEADAMRYGSLFTVYERLKHRQRFILWPKHVNSNVEYSADFSLPGTDAQIKEIRDIVWAITFDLTASFYQCELAPEVRPYFCFRTKEGIFRFKRMVMGFSPAAEIMDTILRVISTRATIDAGVPGTPTTYIDNVRYGHSSKVNVMTWGTSFRRTCQHAGITLNVEPGNTPHQLGTFLGVEFDYAAGTCRLTAKSLSKLNHIATFLHSNVTFDDIFELFGVLFFCSCVLRHRIPYHPFKFYRKRASSFNKHGDGRQSTTIWPSVIIQLQDWIITLQTNDWTKPTRPVLERNVLYTDASLLGFGAILFDTEGGVHKLAGQWTPLEASRRIEELEAMAISRATAHFATQLASKGLDLNIDNTSVRGSLRKGYSRSYNLDARIREVQDGFTSNNIPDIRVSYVKSGDNIADGLSRGCDNYPTASHSV
jgi:hypothetical protein